MKFWGIFVQFCLRRRMTDCVGVLNVSICFLLVNLFSGQHAKVPASASRQCQEDPKGRQGIEGRSTGDVPTIQVCV